MLYRHECRAHIGAEGDGERDADKLFWKSGVCFSAFIIAAPFSLGEKENKMYEKAARLGYYDSRNDSNTGALHIRGTYRAKEQHR